MTTDVNLTCLLAAEKLTEVAEPVHVPTLPAAVYVPTAAVKKSGEYLSLPTSAVQLNSILEILLEALIVTVEPANALIDCALYVVSRTTEPLVISNVTPSLTLLIAVDVNSEEKSS